MVQLESSLPGVFRMERLFGHYRLLLDVLHAPSELEVKVFQGADGQFRLKASHRPAVKGKPGIKVKGEEKTPFERLLEGPYPSLEIALSDLMRELVVVSSGARQVTWEANPQF